MKVAITTRDGKTTGQHFSEATKFLVVTFDKQYQETHRETRLKKTFKDLKKDNPAFDPSIMFRSSPMYENIRDCTFVISGRMSRAEYINLNNGNIKPIITDIIDIEEVIKAFRERTIVDLTDRLY